MLQESQVQQLDHILEGGPFEACEETDAIKHLRFLLWDQVKLLDTAVELLDTIKGNDLHITCYSSQATGAGGNSKTKRRCWRVPGSTKGTEYTCFINFCPCRSYIDMSKQQGQARTVMCKHLVAVRMATLLGWVTQEAVNDAQFVAKMCQETSESAFASTSRTIQW